MNNIEQILNSLDSWASKWQQRQKLRVPGLAICVRDNSGVIFSKAYGVHDKASGEPLDTDSLFPIGSQSKTFTAVAILKLVAGHGVHPVTGRRLSLEDRITDLLPQFKKVDALQGVTLRDALSHKTKLGEGFYKKEWENRTPSFDELRTFDISTVKSSETPGYSNSMYNLLGLIIEDTSGKPFNDYMRTEIVEKHHLGDIYPGLNAVPEAMRGRIPSGYTGAKLDKKASLIDFGCTNPSGGFYATPEAIAGFYRKLATTDEILPREIADSMFREETKGHGAYGLGMMLNSTEVLDYQGDKNPYFVPGNIGRLVGHSGGITGYLSETRYNLHTGLTVTVMHTGFNVPPISDDPKKEERIRRQMKKAVERIGTPILISGVFRVFAEAGDFSPDRDTRTASGAGLDEIYRQHLDIINQINPVDTEADNRSARRANPKTRTFSKKPRI